MRQGKSIPWENDFLASFASGSTVTEAARQACISTTTVYDRRKSDPAFAKQFADAEQKSLAAEASRILGGTPSPQTQATEQLAIA